MYTRAHSTTLTVMIAFITVSVASAAVIYVDDGATGNNNGTSWADAFVDLQAALGAAERDDEIRVAQGVYRPAGPDGDRMASFVIPDGVTLLGGFAGVGSSDPDERGADYPSILCGDLNGDDATAAPEALLNDPRRQDNSHHVVKTAYVYPSAYSLLDGFTITGGNANGDHYTKTSGAGIEASSYTFAVQNCIIEFNSAADRGGGCDWVRTLSNCIVRNNYAGQGGGLIGPTSLDSCRIEGNAAENGGGIYEPSYEEDEAFVNCIIQDNRAVFGGGLYMTNHLASCEGCLFEGNTATEDGGAVYIMNNCTCRSELTLNRCKLAGNKAGTRGGGLYQEGNPQVWLVSSLVSGNTADDDGGGLYCNLYQGMVGSGWCSVTNSTIVHNTAAWNGGGVSCIASVPEYFSMVNSILWGNRDQTGSGTWDAQFRLSTTGTGTGTQTPPPASTYEPVNYCCIQGWMEALGGEGNIGEDPLFADADGADDEPGTGDHDYHLTVDSPCIDAGRNSPSGGTSGSGTPSTVSGGCALGVDLDGNPRIRGGIVDMGAYEFQYAVGAILYVDDGAGGIHNGANWGDAFTKLQDALAVAAAGQEIRVAQGTYRPADPNGPRESSFILKDGVAVRGGFAGYGSDNPDARDIERYETVLSGDLAGNDVNLERPEDLGWEPTRMENSYRVVTASRTNETAILDGFIITGGNANYLDFSQCSGAGMYNDQASPTVIDCTFIMNFAGNDDGGGLGAAIYNYESRPVFAGCKFMANAAIALDGGGGCGGAMGNWSSNPKLTRCRFAGNICGRDGGGMWNYQSNPALVNCLFAGNLARQGGSGSYGGAIYSYGDSLSLSNCTFAGNIARSLHVGDAGGAVYCEYLTGLSLLNSIFHGNRSTEDSQIALRYCDAVSIRYCNIEGGSPGTEETNIDLVPQFAALGSWDTNGTPDDPTDDRWTNGDYHLKSQAGRWDASARAWVQDAVTSPCIDAGSPAVAIMFEPFPNGGVVNMGAYGGTAEASKAWFGGEVCGVIVTGDLNGDCVVNLADVALMAVHWLEDRR